VCGRGKDLNWAKVEACCRHHQRKGLHTEAQIAEIYDISRQNINQHIASIYKDGELVEKPTCKKFLRVQTEGSRQVERSIEHYNLDVIIALGYRVQLQIATRFRRWATKRLHEYIQKGFTIDDERLNIRNFKFIIRERSGEFSQVMLLLCNKQL